MKLPFSSQNILLTLKIFYLFFFLVLLDKSDISISQHSNLGILGSLAVTNKINDMIDIFRIQFQIITVFDSYINLFEIYS